MSTKEEVLAAAFEKALADHLGVDEFTGEEYPQLATAMAYLVHRATHVNPGMCSPSEVAWNAQEYARALSIFHQALAEIVE